MQKKGFLNLGIKVLSPEENTDVIKIKGYCSTNSVDRDNDLVLAEIIDTKNFDKNPIVLYQHNWDKPIGKVLKHSIDSRGMTVECEIYKELNPQAFNAIKYGVLKTFSIGFLGKGRWDENTDLYIFEHVELLEVSIVSIPSNADSIFEMEKICENGQCLMKQLNSKHYTKTPEHTTPKTIPKDLHMEEKLKSLEAELSEIKNQLAELLKGLQETAEGQVEKTTEEPENKDLDEGVAEEKELSLTDHIEAVAKALENKDNIETLMKFYEEFGKQLNDKINQILEGE